MNLLKAMATVSSMTLLSRILGFIRDTVIARAFGAGLYTDAFFVAFKIPNLLRRLFGEGAFSQAFVPILSEYKNKQDHEKTRELIDHVATLLGLVLFVVTLIGVIAAPIIIYITAPGFTAASGKMNLTIDLLRVTFPYIFFISLVALAGGVLNTYNKFSVPAFTPVLLNLSLIVFAFWLAPYFNPPVMALAWGVFLGGVLQLGFQIPFLLRLKIMPRFKLNFRDPGVRRVLFLMGPAIFGVSISQISLLINTIFASFLVNGSVSWLYYADRLMEFPTAMLGVALGTILLPSLSKHYSSDNTEEFSKLLDWGLRLTLLLTLPAAVGLAILAVPLISTLFFYGKFDVLDVWMTRQALVAYSVGLLGLIMVKILAPGFYARQNIKTPVKIALITLIATQIMNLIFIIPFRHAGLALAIGLGACLNAGLLYWQLRRKNIFLPQTGWWKFVIKILVAVGVMALCLWLAGSTNQAWLIYSAPTRSLYLSGLLLLGTASYFVTLWLLGLRVKDFVKRGVE